MPLKKLQLKPGVNRENTRYTNESGWYDCDKVRFRQGTPEKIGGWKSFTQPFVGICRSIWNWVTLGGQNLLGIGTSQKFYINQGGSNYDITPIRATVTLTNPFTTVLNSATVTVTDLAGGYIDGDWVTFSGATTFNNVNMNGEFQISNVDAAGVGTYTVTASTLANAGSTGGGTVTAAYQINVGSSVATPFAGWGSGGWGLSGWGTGTISSISAIRLWSQSNFGQDLIFGPRGGPVYYWDAALGVSNNRGVNITSLSGADANTPIVQNLSFVTDTSRFVMVFGTNDYGSLTQNPMLIRWSDPESVVDWTPSATTEAGSLVLSHGSEIIGALQSRQEILVWTDSTLYSLQYLGAPLVWGSQLLADNISIVSQNAMAVASGVTYWMGVDKFYRYDGRTTTLRCDLRQYVFGDINLAQAGQVFAGTNEGFNEVWWFYCSAGTQAAPNDTIDRYVVYNYAEDIWYYGSMGRTAWLDSGLRDYPMAATYSNNLVYHENGLDDDTTGTPLPIESYIASSEFDIDDGHQVGFVWRVLPDITFRGSSPNIDPSVTMYLYPLQNSGSGINSPVSVGGISQQTVAESKPPSTAPGAGYTVEKFTGQINTRVRGRQLIMQVRSTGTGVQWQLGSPRLDIRPDGRR
jgi:hypothetical protein